MRKVIVLGVGTTKFGISKLSLKEMFAEAALSAVADAQVTTKDIEALFIGNALGGYEEGQINLAPYLAAELALPPDVPATRYEGACASATVAVRQAVLMVAAGEHDLVLAGGTERANTMGTPLATKTFAMSSHAEYEAFAGLTFPGVFGMACFQYSDKYGIPLGDLKRSMARVAIKNHHHATMNPMAHFQNEIDEDTVLTSPLVADPIQLYDCCPFSDGASALIIAAEEKFRGHTDHRPVAFIGTGQGAAGGLYRQRDLTRPGAREASIKKAYAQAGITPDQVDVCELHDCFTIAEILAIEGLGFFEFGRGAEAVDRGQTGLRGQVVVNPSGGLKAKGHPIGATGAAQTYEIVKQLRGDCGPRQVEGAKIGVVDTLGGDFSTVCHLILGRD